MVKKVDRTKNRLVVVMTTIGLKLQTKPKRLSKVSTTCSMTTKMMTTLIKKAKDSAAEYKKENDDGKNQKMGI